MANLLRHEPEDHGSMILSEYNGDLVIEDRRL